MGTTRGTARVHLRTAVGRRVQATLVLGHGAGRGTDTADLQAIATELPASGVTVVLVDQPWVVAGRRVAAPAATLDDAWIQVLAWLRDNRIVTERARLTVGGRSTGARVACRTAAAVDADALLLLAFPLLPPASRKDPERAARASAIRLGEWRAAGERSVVLVQGERDAFGSPADVLAALAELDLAQPVLVAVPGADHSLRLRTSAAREALITAALRATLGE
ncbi:MAG: alpha/beta family hydrolase [Candidatus Nanopelagicales bacterium]